MATRGSALAADLLAVTGAPHTTALLRAEHSVRDDANCHRRGDHHERCERIPDEQDQPADEADKAISHMRCQAGLPSGNVVPLMIQLSRSIRSSQPDRNGPADRLAAARPDGR